MTLVQARTRHSIETAAVCEAYLAALDGLPDFNEIERRQDILLGRISEDHYVLLAVDPDDPEVTLAWVVDALPERGQGWVCRFEDVGHVQITHFFRR